MHIYFFISLLQCAMNNFTTPLINATPYFHNWSDLNINHTNSILPEQNEEVRIDIESLIKSFFETVFNITPRKTNGYLKMGNSENVPNYPNPETSLKENLINKKKEKFYEKQCDIFEDRYETLENLLKANNNSLEKDLRLDQSLISNKKIFSLIKPIQDDINDENNSENLNLEESPIFEFIKHALQKTICYLAKNESFVDNIESINVLTRCSNPKYILFLVKSRKDADIENKNLYSYDMKTSEIVEINLFEEVVNFENEKTTENFMKTTLKKNQSDNTEPRTCFYTISKDDLIKKIFTNMEKEKRVKVSKPVSKNSTSTLEKIKARRANHRALRLKNLKNKIEYFAFNQENPENN